MVGRLEIFDLNISLQDECLNIFILRYSLQRDAAWHALLSTNVLFSQVLLRAANDLTEAHTLDTASSVS